MATALDAHKLQAFARQLFTHYTGGMLTLMIQIGYRTGLFEAAATAPATSAELTRRTGLSERYVREWLGAMTTGGIMVYDQASGVYALPAEHAACLTGASRLSVAAMSGVVPSLARHLPRIVEVFAKGGGLPYAEFQPDFTEILDEATRRIYDDTLITGFLPKAPDITERLSAGVLAADIGCGTGHAVNLMARAFPASEFVGYDIGEAAIATAREEAGAMGLTNASFEVRDVTALPRERRFDVIFAFDAIHDQVEPAAVLQGISDALAPDGLFFMMDIRGSSDVHEDMDNFFAPFYYSVSVMHCMTVSLAEGGAGLGTAWGVETARRMLDEVGFTSVEVVDAPGPQNSIFICRLGAR